MDRLISLQAAIDAICKEGTRLERNGTVAMCEIKQWCIDLLERLPSAQPERTRLADKDHVWINGKQYISLQRFQKAVKEAQPEIIRCGECTHKDKKIDYCHYLGITICERDYCSYAVRRSDG